MLLLSGVVDMFDSLRRIPNMFPEFGFDFSALPPLPSISMDKALRSVFSTLIPVEENADVVDSPPTPLILRSSVVKIPVSKASETPLAFSTFKPCPPYPSISTAPCELTVVAAILTPWESLSSPSELPPVPLILTDPCSPVCDIIDPKSSIPDVDWR